MFNHQVVNECITFLNDPSRNQWYREKLKSMVKDRVVFEIGCGAGILASYALEFGAKHYYGIDIKSNRAKFTSSLLKDLGYGNKSTVWCADFTHLKSMDIPHDVDILLCEQVASQFQSNLTIKQFWIHAAQIFTRPFMSLPDQWAIDAHIYLGEMSSSLPEHQPRLLLDDPLLPTGYYQALQNTCFIQPRQTIKNAFKITPDDCHKDPEFVLDLRNYASATVVLSDHISYQNHVCISSSATTDWPPPIKILVNDANALIKFSWDCDDQFLPDYRQGFWTSRPC